MSIKRAALKRKALRALGCAAYAGALVLVFGLAAYTSFSSFVRSGATRTPDLVGLGSDAATAALIDQGLVLVESEVEGQYSETVPAGHVARQRPSAGTLVKRGSRVEILLSLGPQRVPVPDLSGQALPSAQVALAAAGLPLGRTVSIFAPGSFPGAVVGQSPQPGAAVAPDESVDLLLALGGGRSERYLMPDLVYRDYEDVKRFFERRGFRFGSVRFEPYEGLAGGVILRQFPLAGHPFSQRDAVSLVVTSPDLE